MILPTHVVAAGGVIVNDKNEILLVKNPRKGWEYPGGVKNSITISAYIFSIHKNNEHDFNAYY